MTLGFVLLIMALLNEGRRLFSDSEIETGKESVEIMKDLAGRPWLRFYAIFDALNDRSAHQVRNDSREARLRSAGMRGARSEISSPSQIESSKDSAKPVDYWTLPKTGPRATVFNSGWTWTLVFYAILLGAASVTVLQAGYNVFTPDRALTAIGGAILLLYPAFRIGTIVSRLLKSRFPGPVTPTGEADPARVSPDGKDLKARMAERRARVEQARKDGKL